MDFFLYQRRVGDGAWLVLTNSFSQSFSPILRKEHA